MCQSLSFTCYLPAHLALWHIYQMLLLEHTFSMASSCEESHIVFYSCLPFDVIFLLPIRVYFQQPAAYWGFIMNFAISVHGSNPFSACSSFAFPSCNMWCHFFKTHFSLSVPLVWPTDNMHGKDLVNCIRVLTFNNPMGLLFFFNLFNNNY